MHALRVNPGAGLLRPLGRLPRPVPLGGQGSRLWRGVAPLGHLGPRSNIALSSHGQCCPGPSADLTNHVLCLNHHETISPPPSRPCALDHHQHHHRAVFVSPTRRRHVSLYNNSYTDSEPLTENTDINIYSSSLSSIFSSNYAPQRWQFHKHKKHIKSATTKNHRNELLTK